jgi:Uma2 family endonuclease
MGTLAIPAKVLVEVYLNRSYSPDRDYVDGEVQKRNVGEMPHASVQKFFLMYFGSSEQELRVRVYPEQRVQTSETHYRVADICVVRGDAPWECIVRTPPLLCIEVLSPKDRMSRVQERVDDYIGMGVPVVWVVDPRKRAVLIADRSATLQPASEVLSVDGTDIEIETSAVFAELDRFDVH